MEKYYIKVGTTHGGNVSDLLWTLWPIMLIILICLGIYFIYFLIKFLRVVKEAKESKCVHKQILEKGLAGFLKRVKNMKGGVRSC
jgi:heme/copper-type cytochrome/quinol oxidase subunit 2